MRLHGGVAEREALGDQLQQFRVACPGGLENVELPDRFGSAGAGVLEALAVAVVDLSHRFLHRLQSRVTAGAFDRGDESAGLAPKLCRVTDARTAKAILIQCEPTSLLGRAAMALDQKKPDAGGEPLRS